MDRPFNVDPAVGRALLAAEAEGRADDPFGRLFQIGPGGDNRWILAAHLDDRRARVAGGELAEQLETDVVRAGEHDPVDSRVLLELLADRVAGTHDQVEGAVGQPRVAIGLDEVDARQGGRGARLEDNGVAGHQRGGRRASGQGHREVERADHGEDAQWPEDRAGVDRRVAEVVHRVVVAVVALHHVGVVAQQVGRLLHLAQGLEPALADLEGHVRAVDHLALADQLGCPAHDRQALAPGGGRPRRLGGPGGGDRVAHVLAGALGKVADDDLMVDRRMDGRLAVALALRPADEVQVVSAKLAAALDHTCVIQRVELLVVVAERGVGDLQARLRVGRHRCLPLSRVRALAGDDARRRRLVKPV